MWVAVEGVYTTIDKEETLFFFRLIVSKIGIVEVENKKIFDSKHFQETRFFKKFFRNFSEIFFSGLRRRDITVFVKLIQNLE